MCASITLLWLGILAPVQAASEVKSRTFRFIFEATVTGLKADESARIWLPVPSNSTDQHVEIVEHNLPGRSSLNRESKYGNRILDGTAAPEK